MVSSPFKDNPEKRVVREQWNTPLLQYLHQQYGVKYRYLGLPGTELIDVILWKDMIEEVIAFEPPDKDTGGREAFNTLSVNFRKLLFQGHLYCGTLEEVLLQRRDREGQEYVQDKVVTLYNLDFCNEISSRIQTNEGSKVWRFEAIRQVLRDQLDCYKREKNAAPQYFILMVTVRNQISAGKILYYLRPSALQGDARHFFKKCSATNAIPQDKNTPLLGSHSWALKALLHHILCTYFGNPNFSALFFPPVLYEGTKTQTDNGPIASPMIHLLVLCRFGDDTAATPEFLPEQYLSRPSIKVRTKKRLVWAPQTGEQNHAGNTPDAVAWLRQYGGGILNGIKASTKKS